MLAVKLRNRAELAGITPAAHANRETAAASEPAQPSQGSKEM